MDGRGLALAARALRHGKIVAYPTEGVYGLGCDPRQRAAVARLLKLKRRRWQKGLILIAADPAQLAPYVADLPDIARRTWPGPHTWLVPARPDCPRWLRGVHELIAVRITAHPLAAGLCRTAGMALVSTSANRAGAVPARFARDVRRRLGHRVDYVLAGRVGARKRPTPIRNALTGASLRA